MKIRGLHEDGKKIKLKGERLRCGTGLPASPACIPPCFVPVDRSAVRSTEGVQKVEFHTPARVRTCEVIPLFALRGTRYLAVGRERRIDYRC